MARSTPLQPRRWLRMASALSLICGWAVFPLRAELTWPAKTVELHPDASTAVVEARFPFTNSGTTPVDIRQVQSSCGCTTASLTQRHFDPGADGEIVAHFTIGERVGLQTKKILVSTSDNFVPTALTLVVCIPELARVQPAFVTWQSGEANAPKVVQVESSPNAGPLAEVSVQSSNHAMAVELQPVSEGGKYPVRITPETTEKALYSTLTIRCRLGKETKTFHAFASVQPPLPPPKRPSTPPPDSVAAPVPP